MPLFSFLNLLNKKIFGGGGSTILNYFGMRSVQLKQMAGSQRPQIPSFIPYQFGMWPWASHESKIYDKRHNNALHVHGILWFNSTLSHTMLFNLTPSLLRGIQQSYKIFHFKEQGFETQRNLIASSQPHLQQMSEPENVCRHGAGLCHPSLPYCHSVVSSSVIDTDRQHF